MFHHAVRRTVLVALGITASLVPASVYGETQLTAIDFNHSDIDADEVIIRTGRLEQTATDPYLLTGQIEQTYTASGSTVRNDHFFVDVSVRVTPPLGAITVVAASGSVTHNLSFASNSTCPGDTSVGTSTITGGRYSRPASDPRGNLVLTGSTTITHTTWSESVDEQGHPTGCSSDVNVASGTGDVLSFQGVHEFGPSVTISIGDAAELEGGTGSNNHLSFSVSLSGPAPAGGVSVSYGTSDGTAQAGTDYQVTAGTLNFLAGETAKTIAVPINGDTAIEPNETLSVTLSNAAGASFLDAVGLGTILDDESLDSDGDGLLDNWEVEGLDADGDGNIDLDLGAMGADPLHKDIFIEIDAMTGHELSNTAVAKVVAAFAAAPVTNPDGATGIRMHIDNGPSSIMNPVTGATWGSLSDADSLAHETVLGTLSGSEYNWAAFDTIKADNFASARSHVFHYVVSAHRFGAATQGSSGISRDIGASDFIVSLGSASEPGEGSGTIDQQAGTIMHELGHNLGLRHGGSDDTGYKPNYLSIMNYAFQMSGLRRADGTFVLDYSRFSIALDETALDQANGFGFASGSTEAQFNTLARCPGSGSFHIESLLAGPLDWDCDPATAGTVSASVNGDAVVEQLQGFLDWPALIYDGGAIGDLGVVVLPATTPLIEPGIEELLEAERVLRGSLDTTPPQLTVPTDLTVDATSPAGAAVEYDASAEDSTDPAPVVECTPPPGATFAIGTTVVMCTATDEAGNSAHASFDVHVRGANEQFLALMDRTRASVDLLPFEAVLVGWLQDASGDLARDVPGACRVLDRYIRLVTNAPETLLAGDDASALLVDSHRIRTVIPCSP